MKIRDFARLEWKQFSRSSYFQKGLAIKILLGLGALYFMAMALFVGVGVLYGLEKAFPGQDAFQVLNNYLIYYVLGDLALRYFLQQLPVMNIKPLLMLPIKRSVVIRYLLLKTNLSFFNFLPILFFVPIAGVLLYKSYDVLGTLTWLVSFICIGFSINYANFLINKTKLYFFVILGIVALLLTLNHFEIIDIASYFGAAFYAIYTDLYWVIIPIVVLVFLFKVNYRFIRQHFYTDGAIVEKSSDIKTYNLSFLDRFGSLSLFLKNDVRLILRNARPKQVMLTSFFFLFYGLIFYTQDMYTDMPAILAFASMFVTGGFLLTFGQLVPSWDSEYYKLMMSQNIPYRQYLESKLYLMISATVISLILSTPYLFFGWDIYAMILAGASFNIGLNSFITLYGGALNRVPVELNQKAKAFSNTNGFSPTQLLISLPKILGPMLIFYIPYKFISFDAGLIALGLSGVVGLLLKNVFLNKIEKIYQKGKYKTIAAFDEKK
ncbi:MAG: DUF5687 family protein [Psychroflexus sp.]|nr:DUF5687 family protein [Psychroflexus sp.]MDN6311148.1 DUF5687 family protein [Psychroflexus sp.]